MPDSNVPITAGTGTLIDSRTESTNSHHRQVVVLGDPSVNDGVAEVRASDPDSNDMGIVVRDPNSTAIVAGLDNVRVRSIVDGTVSVENITRVRNIVDGTLSTVTRVSNVVDGSIKVTDVIPGVGATNLGKAIGNAAGGTDTGVAVVGEYEETDTHTTDADGDYIGMSMTGFREIRTRDQRAIDLCNCNDSTAVTVLGNDTINLANATNHVFGTGALSFDKANGAANTVYAGVYDTFTAININEIFEAGGFVGLGCYLPSLTNVVNVFLRIGTDASNYNCWTWPVAQLTAATWMNLRTAAASPDYARNLGTGWNTNAIAYVAFGVEFSTETDTLAGIIFDHVHIVGGRVTATDISTATSINTPNINIQRVGGNVTSTGNGVVASGTQRVSIASDSTGSLARVDRIANVVDGTLSTVTGIDRVRNVIDGTLSTVQRVQNIIDGTLSTITGVDRVRNIVDGTLSTVTGVDRVRNIVDGTISLVSTVTGVDRVRNIVDGTLSTVTGIDRVRNIVDGTLSLVTTVTGIDRVRNIVDGTLSLVSTVTGVDRVRVLVDGTLTTVTGITNTVKIAASDGTLAVYLNPALTMGSVSHIDDTVKISAPDGTIAVYLSPAAPHVRLVGLGSTTNIFTVSGSVTGSYPSGKTLVAPSANYSFKVFAVALTTTAQAHSVVTLQNGGGSPTEFWRYALQAPAQGVAGANVTVTPPGFLFATGANVTLGIAVDSASLVHYSVSYIKESA